MTYNLNGKWKTSEPLSIENLLELECITHDAKDLLEKAIKAKCNILISGGTGAGKTTLLNALANMISNNNKIITFQDSQELYLKKLHFLHYELFNLSSTNIDRLVQFACSNGSSKYILFDQFKNDGLLELIYGVHYSKVGMMATTYGINPNNAMERLLSIVKETPTYINQPIKFKKMVGENLDLVVQIARLKDGTRKITEISQLKQYNEEQDLFEFCTLFSFVPTSNQSDKVEGTLERKCDILSYKIQKKINNN